MRWRDVEGFIAVGLWLFVVAVCLWAYVHQYDDADLFRKILAHRRG